MSKQEQKLARNEDSLAPIQLDRLSVEEESLIKHRGRGGQLAMVVVLAVGLAAGGAHFMKQLDAKQAIVSAAAGVQHIRTDKLEPFLSCALPGIGQTQLDSKERLIGAIDDFSESLGKGYAHTLTRCLPVLEEVAPALAAQTAPGELQGKVDALHQAAVTLTQAVRDYRDALSASADKYDPVQALPKIEQIASAWGTYQITSKQFDDAARAKVK